jgi:serralysin
MSNLTAISASSFLNTLGINTHIDFDADGYQNLATVEAAINYLGVKNIRDSGQAESDISAWLQVAQATGAKFDDYIGQTSPAGMLADLVLAQQLAQEGVLNYIEGGNEEDDSYPESLGNNQWIAAQFQQQVYALAQQYGLPTINISFGAGWTAANNWEGDYATVGSLSAFANYANAHTYPVPGQTPDSVIQQLNADALLAAPGDPVMTTEIGWDSSTFSETAIAQYVVDAAFDGIKDGDTAMYYYALFNDVSGNYGLMNADGSPTPAGTALHDLTTLLSDTGGSFTPGSLDVTLGGALSTDNTVLIQKSDGSDWLALWDETAGTHAVTVTLPTTASQIQVFDPVTGTGAIGSASNADSITVSLGSDPLLIEIIPAGSQAGSGSGTTTTAVTTSSTGSDPSVSSPGSGGSSAGTPNDLAVAVPASETVAAGATQAVSGVSVSDAWAAGTGGDMALNVWDQTGTLTIGGQTFGPGGSPVPDGMLSGSLAQINADLATLSYTAGGNAGSDTITVNVWNQAGVQATETIPVGITSDGGGATTGGTPQDDVTIPSGNADAVENVSNATISAAGANQLIFIGGTGDTLTATGGGDTVQAFQGGNTITTGGGNNAIYISGSNNVVNAGSGNNTLFDSGTDNTIALPTANQGYDDIYGYVMQNGDTLDLSNLLANTSWNGDTATIGNYLSVTQSGDSAVINADPSGVSGGASNVVATLEGAGPLSLNTLLAHATT